MKLSRVAGLTIVVAVAALWLLRTPRLQAPAATSPAIETEVTVSGTTSPPSEMPLTKATSPSIPSALSSATTPELERQSLDTLSSMFADENREHLAPAALIKRLVSSGYMPVASRDQDDVLGSLITIETKNALPGSRYFRAQFFSDETGNYEAQHISVEFRPGTPIPEIVHMLESKFGRLNKTNLDTADEKLYKTEDGHSLYVKRLDDSDIQENAIHAYSPDDRGTIFVSYERDLPGHENEDFAD